MRQIPAILFAILLALTAAQAQGQVLVINEICADPGSDANEDGTYHQVEDEFVELVNQTDSDLDISGWTLSDADMVRHVFPPGTVLIPGCCIVVFGGGSPTGSFGDGLVQVASEGVMPGLWLDNLGDSVFIHNGGTLVTSYTYSAPTVDVSLTRYPDITGPEPLVPHNLVSGSDFSPGLTVFGQGFPGCSPQTWYRDADYDLWGDENDTVVSGTQPNGYVDLPGDCNDFNSSIYPGAPEICGDGVDSDCDGYDPAPDQLFYEDADQDGFGGQGDYYCEPPGPGYTDVPGDCDDADSTVYPGAPELVDGLDNDCDGFLLPDEQDQDQDNFVAGTIDPGGWDGAGNILGGDDCDDTRNTVYPGADEICGDSLDNNCNGNVDEGCVTFEILTLADVGNDQGRQVRLTWSRARDDTSGTAHTVTGYSIYRRIDGNKAANWDFLGTVPANGEAVYNAVAATLCDSTDAGVCWSAFFVRAQTTDPLTFFDTAPDSGWSVDNLAPSPPANPLLAAGTLTWDQPVDPDVRFVTVYGSANGVLDGSEVVIGYSTETSFDVSGAGHAYYLLTATDFAGNQGAAVAVFDDVSPVPGTTPQRTVLLGNHPNPFNPSTVIEFELERAQAVSLQVYDMSGRLVKSLIRGETRPAGSNEISWDGHDTAGRIVPAGVYFYRFETGSYSSTRRMVLLK